MLIPLDKNSTSLEEYINMVQLSFGVCFSFHRTTGSVSSQTFCPSRCLTIGQQENFWHSCNNVNSNNNVGVPKVNTWWMCAKEVTCSCHVLVIGIIFDYVISPTMSMISVRKTRNPSSINHVLTILHRWTGVGARALKSRADKWVDIHYRISLFIDRVLLIPTRRCLSHYVFVFVYHYACEQNAEMQKDIHASLTHSQWSGIRETHMHGNWLMNNVNMRIKAFSVFGLCIVYLALSSPRARTYISAMESFRINQAHRS